MYYCVVFYACVGLSSCISRSVCMHQQVSLHDIVGHFPGISRSLFRKRRLRWFLTAIAAKYSINKKIYVNIQYLILYYGTVAQGGKKDCDGFSRRPQHSRRHQTQCRLLHIHQLVCLLTSDINQSDGRVLYIHTFMCIHLYSTADVTSQKADFYIYTTSISTQQRATDAARNRQNFFFPSRDSAIV